MGTDERHQHPLRHAAMTAIANAAARDRQLWPLPAERMPWLLVLDLYKLVQGCHSLECRGSGTARLVSILLLT